jgi:hypothetical protein
MPLLIRMKKPRLLSPCMQAMGPLLLDADGRLDPPALAAAAAALLAAAASAVDGRLARCRAAMLESLGAADSEPGRGDPLGRSMEALSQDSAKDSANHDEQHDAVLESLGAAEQPERGRGDRRMEALPKAGAETAESKDSAQPSNPGPLGQVPASSALAPPAAGRGRVDRRLEALVVKCLRLQRSAVVRIDEALAQVRDRFVRRLPEERRKP